MSEANQLGDADFVKALEALIDERIAVYMQREAEKHANLEFAGRRALEKEESENPNL